MHWGLVPGFAAALAVCCAQPAKISPELANLVRIKTTMSRTLARQPNYTCVQEIERSRRRLPKRRFELHDLLRLEVALVDGHEMYAWPGARKFEQTDLTAMVSGGAIGTGDFALHARSVFETSSPQFKFAGEATIRGRDTLRYDYVVPVLSSGYKIRSSTGEAIVGYHGSFWADPVTFEPLRLEVNADDIPESLGIAVAKDVMDYDRVHIGASDFLLPIGSELTMTDLAGNESRNQTRFQSCRQYSGESVLRFDDAPDDNGVSAAPAEKQVVQIPDGAGFDVVLETAIDSANSAVGDQVKATLKSDLKSHGRLLFPKGAVLLGRITRLERHPDETVLELQFRQMESDDSRATLAAQLYELGIAGLEPTGFSPLNRSFTGSARVRTNAIQVRGNRLHLRPGTRLHLRNGNE